MDERPSPLASSDAQALQKPGPAAASAIGRGKSAWPDPAQVSIRDVSIRFGGLQALNGLSLDIAGGEIKAIIGPNGAGKSTFVNCLTGIVQMDSGEVAIDGQVATRPLMPKLVELGIGRTFQNIRLFPTLTVREHVELAYEGFARSRRARREKKRAGRDATCERLLARTGLAGRERLDPRDLSYGERRRLEIARALALQPKLLLLDEPAAGMVPSEQADLAVLIREIGEDGVAVILIEHHMDLVASVASEIIVLNFGSLVMKGTMAEVRSDPQVISAYLGSTAAA